MKRFAYYPGCSLETTAAAYHVSAVEVASRLGVEFVEVEDWNCCGATSYSGIDDLLGQTLCARNLAIAERSGLDVVAPCSACYKNLHSAAEHLQHDADLAEHVNFALEADQLSYAGKTSVHHLIHMFVGEVGLPAIKAKVTKPLTGLKVAPYYGCLLVRPRRDDAWASGNPRFFEDLLRTLGATALEYPFRMRCCGGSLVASNRRAALSLLRDLLRGARQVGADVIATTCPLCQFNLECYQAEVNREFGTDFAVPIVYFTQLMGVAMGVATKKLGFGAEVIPVQPVLDCAARKPAAAKASHGPKVTTP